MENLQNPFTKASDSEREQILDQIPTPVMAVDTDFRVTYMNQAGLRILGSIHEDVLGRHCFSLFNSIHCNTDKCCMKRAIDANMQYSDRNEVKIGGRPVPIEYYAVPLTNETGEIVGGLEYILDITERVQNEERIKEQSYTIAKMSTPTIKLWDGVLVLPVVGVIDSMRAQHMMESMLNKIGETSSKVIILDIQGVAAVDTAVANHLIKITKATRLMGCECILSGISPAVAQTMIQLGIDMGDIKTNSTLRDALDDAFKILKLEVHSTRQSQD